MKSDFSKARVLVVGDVMLDRYWQGASHRISPEAPVPVVHVNDISSRIGGAGNVATNIASLGANAALFALIGDDREGQELAQLLAQSNIKNHCQIEPGIPTTTKLRVLSQHQQLIRLDFEQPHQQLDTTALLDQYLSSLENADIVVLSDYAKGVLEDARAYIQRANRSSVPVIVDPKKSSFDNYAGAWLLTPNQKEFESVVGHCPDQRVLEEKAHLIIEDHGFNGLLITQGGEGMTLVMKQQPAEHFPAHARDVFDVTGAGDTVVAALATGLASGMPIRDAVNLSCKAAAIVVGRVGTSAVTQEDLDLLDRRESNKLAPIDSKIVTEHQCIQAIQVLRSQGKKIVITNGCFDLIHTGHVLYLEKAARLGDVLIVAVNSDDSVSKLKGSDRPVNPLQDRMQVLASLASVDLVVDFSEDTPERLYCAIEPDVLVKGGDYRVDEIAGHQCAGEVVLIDLVDGKSSSSIVNKIRQQEQAP